MGQTIVLRRLSAGLPARPAAAILVEHASACHSPVWLQLCCGARDIKVGNLATDFDRLIDGRFRQVLVEHSMMAAVALYRLVVKSVDFFTRKEYWFLLVAHVDRQRLTLTVVFGEPAFLAEGNFSG